MTARRPVRALLRAYGAPRVSMASTLAAGVSEGRAVFYLFAACTLGALATLPQAREAAAALPAPARDGAIPAHVFGYLFVAPLILYGLAALLHLAARACGGRGSFAHARAAFFRALLLAGPLALGLAALDALAGPAAWLRVAVGMASAYWLWLAMASLAEAEGIGSARRPGRAEGPSLAG